MNARDTSYCETVRRREHIGVPKPVRDQRRSAHTVPPTSINLGAGSQVGRYVVHRRIGRGGMGIVYGALDPALGRRVALKLVCANNTEALGRYTKRLRREAQALARLSHPNTVGIYDIGNLGGTPYIAMEYLQGQSLRHWLAKSPRTAAEIVDVFVQAGKGVAAAHAAGLIHRDLKPSNIMVCDGTVKVLDFGLARGEPCPDPWAPDSGDSLLCRSMTNVDVIVGTTNYMAPEQLMGEEIGPTADQFAFCVALFEALFNTRPYTGTTAIDLAMAFRDGKFHTPQSRKGVPARVYKAILRGLSIDPAERFRTMDELVEALSPQSPGKLRKGLGIAALLAVGWLAGHADLSSPPVPASAPVVDEQSPAPVAAVSSAGTKPEARGSADLQAAIVPPQRAAASLAGTLTQLVSDKRLAPAAPKPSQPETGEALAHREPASGLLGPRSIAAAP